MPPSIRMLMYPHDAGRAYGGRAAAGMSKDMVKATQACYSCRKQALVLVALYEYGQGIYPAAWMTVAQCVRYADFIGLPSYKDSNSVLGHCGTWSEAEERRRTWWAVYVLDRIVSVGSQKRPLCGEPSPHEILPVEDKAWEASGDAAAGGLPPMVQQQRTVSSPGSEPQSPFGRLCQAALLLGKMLRHAQRAEIRRLAVPREPTDPAEVAGLAATAHRLGACLRAEAQARGPAAYFALVAARCLAFSALFKVLGLYYDYDNGMQEPLAAHAAGVAVPGIVAPPPDHRHHHHQGHHGKGLSWTVSSSSNQRGGSSSSSRNTNQDKHREDHRSEDHDAHDDNNELALRALAHEGLRKATAHMRDLGAELAARVALDDDLARAPPFVLDAVYSAACATATMLHHHHDHDDSDVPRGGPTTAANNNNNNGCGLLGGSGSGFGSEGEYYGLMRKCLARVGLRWRLGGEYLRLLEQREMSALMCMSGESCFGGGGGRGDRGGGGGGGGGGDDDDYGMADLPLVGVTSLGL
ncbi:hypothetical protein GGR56DRAFT_676430 [Xylariaceae sp. FL0804]|nr:hypothetical protein GGR56DRAFT_676430 [Xylariaceae sp. FL0804]